jgi:tetratricopeptide (TPR) repeat protein
VARKALGELKAAIEDLDKAVALDPQFAPAYWRRGEAQLANNNSRAALDDLDRAIKLNPGLAAAHNGRGLAQRAQKDFRSALKSFDTAIELDSRLAEAYSNRALTKMILRDFSGAIADYSQALEINPDLPGFYLNRGVGHRAWGDEIHYEAEARRGRDKAGAAEKDKDAKQQWALAIKDFDKAIAMDPKTPLVYEHRGEAKRASGDLEGAMTDFDRQIQIKPDSSTAYNNRALVRQDKGDFPGALQDLTRAIEANRDDATAYANRGFLLLQLKQPLRAQQDFEACLQLAPQLKPRIDQIIQKIKSHAQDRTTAEGDK